MRVNENKLKVMSLHEFEVYVKAGRNWAIYNNYVLDLTRIIGHHPGGSFVLRKNIGRDIGKFIYGAYSVEPSRMRPHTHSQYAFNAM